MILADVRDYLTQRGRAPLADLAIRFDVEADALRSMLEVWVRKGRVRRIETTPGSCGPCCRCAAEILEIYEWVEAGPAP